MYGLPPVFTGLECVVLKMKKIAACRDAADSLHVNYVGIGGQTSKILFPPPRIKVSVARIG